MKRYRLHYPYRFSDWSYNFRQTSWVGEFENEDEAMKHATELAMQQGMLDDDLSDFVWVEEIL